VLIRIALLGTSITSAGGDAGGWHEGTPAKPGLGPRLRGWLPGHTVEIMDFGKGGNNVDDLAARLPTVIAANPNVVLIDSCTNDSHTSRPKPPYKPSDIEPKILSIVSQTKTALPGCLVGLMTLAPVLHAIANRKLVNTDYFHDAYRRLADDPLIDFLFDGDAYWSRLCDDGRDRRVAYMSDGVHPTQAAMLSFIVPGMANKLGRFLLPRLETLRVVG